MSAEGMRLTPKAREVVRFHPDGTYWIAPDIAPDEAMRALPTVVEFAALQLKRVHELQKGQA